MIEVAAYRGKGEWLDSAIRLWTGGEYSHVEFSLSRDNKSFIGLGASPRDGGVRKKRILIKPSHWDFFPVQADIDLIEGSIGKRYDWAGIFFAQVLFIGKGHPDKFFCSELVATAIGLPRPWTYTPKQIVELIR